MHNEGNKRLRYRAFISYSRKDIRQAKRIQNALEKYKLPQRISSNLQGNRMLGRFFRDDDELGGSSDLGAALRGILEDTENLVIVCSPHSAQSEWVKREIIHFKTTDRAGRVFALIVDGKPMSDDPKTECFSPALRFKVSCEGKLIGEPQEALGIDIRTQSYRKALARLVAGMLNLPFDELWQRKQREYHKKLLKWSIGIFFILVLIGAISIWQARQLWIKSAISLSKTAKQENDAQRFENGLVVSLAAFPEIPSFINPIIPEARAQLERSGYNNRLIASWPNGSRDVSCVAFSPDGRLLLAGEASGKVTLRNVSDGTVIRTLQYDSGAINTISYSSKGNLIAIGNDNGMVAIWNSKSGRLMRAFSVNSARIVHVSFSTNGKMLLTAGYDGYVRLWQTPTFQKIIEIKAHKSYVKDVSLSNDNNRIWTVSSSDKAIRLWDAHSGLMLREYFTDGDVHSIALSPDESKILTAETYDHVAHLRDAKTGAILNTYSGPKDGLVNAVISPDGKSVVGSGSEDGKVWVWNLDNGQVIDQLEGHSFRVNDVTFSPNGNLIASSGADNLVQLWNFWGPTHYLNQKRLNSANIHAESIFSSNDSLYIVAADSRTNDLQIWEVHHDTLTATLSGNTQSASHVIVNSSGDLLLSSSLDGTVRVWDLNTKRQLRQFSFPFSSEDNKGVWYSIFTKSNDYVLSAGRDGTVRTWRIDTGKEVNKIKAERQVEKVLLSSDEGKIITFCSGSSSVELWDRKSGDLLRRFNLPPDGLGYERVQDIAFSPNGKYIAAASSDRLAIMWDVETGKEIHHFSGHPFSVRRVLFSPNGRNLITIGNEDATMRFWDITTGELIFKIPNYRVSHQVISFGNDSSELILLDDNSSIMYWDISLSSMSNEELLNYARKTWPQGLLPQGRSHLSEYQFRKLLDAGSDLIQAK